jgi:hypothetical protein
MSEILLPEAATNGVKFEKLSSKYDLISTESVVQIMREEGFLVTQSNSLKPRKRDPRVVRHFVRMRHESHMNEINGSVTEILVINANDGTSSLRMEAGLFRLVCSNGLIIKSQDVGSARIRHMDVTEIAAAMNKPEGTIKSWLFRARAMLKKDLTLALG